MGNSDAMSISWHEECCKNQRNSLDREKRELEDKIKFLENDIAKISVSISEYELQIQMAKKRRLDRFDRSRFLRKTHNGQILESMK